MIPTDPTSQLDDAGLLLELGAAAPVLSLDVLRRTDCCIELYVSGVMALLDADVRTESRSFSAGTLTPVMVQLGLNYRLHSARHTTTRLRQWLYVTPFLTFTSGDRSRKVEIDGGTTPEVVVDLHSAVGLGLGAGWRYRHTEALAVDLSAKWQHLPVRTGDEGRISLGPFSLSAGLVLQLP